MTKVHIGGSDLSGAACGYGSIAPDRDIVVSALTLFKEIARQHRCRHCVKDHYPYGGDPEIDRAVLDQPEAHYAD